MFVLNFAEDIGFPRKTKMEHVQEMLFKSWQQDVTLHDK